MTRRIVPLAAAALFLTAPAWAEEVSDHDRFRLWNECKPTHLVVEDLPQAAADIGLAEGAIETAVRSRLRGARLYDAGGSEFLYVNVSTLGLAFSISAEYNKRILDPVSGQVYHAETWSTGIFGTHGGNAGYVLSSVSQGVDKFIDEYLRVNAEACGR